jgi:hypothetical protein
MKTEIEAPRVVYLLEGDLEAMISRGVSDAISKLKLSGESESKKVYGINGIAETLGCSRSTAHRIKESGALDGAISQVGKVIVGYEHRIIEAGAAYFRTLKEKKQKAIKQPRKITLR